MLFLRVDQVFSLLNACKNQKETLAIRYFAFNGLSPSELANARIEHLDPIEGTLFLPHRHWKNNCVTHIDPETIQLQIVYSGDRKKGPLLISRLTKGHFSRDGLWRLVRRVASNTSIPDAEHVCPLVLKRTFAREWLRSGGTIGSLQKQFSHKHLWSTAHYLRFFMEDVRHDHIQFMRRIQNAKTKSTRLVP